LHPVREYSSLEMTEAATLADEEHTGESAPGNGLLPNTLSEDASSISSKPQETSAIILAETTTASIPAEISCASIPPETTSASIPTEMTSASIPPETTSDHSLNIPRNDRSSVAFARTQLAVRGICEKRE